MSKEPAEKNHSAEHTRTVMAIVDAVMRIHSQCHGMVSLRPVDLNEVIPCMESSPFDRVENAAVNGKIKKWIELADRMLTGNGNATSGMARTHKLPPYRFELIDPI